MMHHIDLNELTLENVGEWPTPVKIGATVVASVLLIAVGYWFVIKNNFEQYDILKEQEGQLRTEFESKQYLASSKHAYYNQMQIMQERFGNMLKQLPSQNEMPGLLEDISKTGVASGLRFDLFAPMPEVVHDFYVELPIKISVVGNYHQLAVFVSRVAQMSRVVTIHDFVIKGASADNQKNDTGDQLSMSLTAKIYRYHTQ